MSPGEEHRWDVFLAHASADKPRARVLYQALTTLGLRVCFDEKVLKLGDRWRRLLPQHLEASSIIIALLSARSAEAHYEEEEIDRAIELMRSDDRRVIPVHLEPDAHRAFGTRGLHRFDLFDDADVPRLAEAIRDLVPVHGAATSPTIFSPLVPEVPEHFTGRDELLEELTGRMGFGTTTRLVQRIQGMGGVGKTTVAAALCRAHRHRLAVVWWVRAEDPTTLLADLAALADELDIASTSEEDATQAVRRWMETTEDPWLLVFDNVGSADALALRPRDGKGTVIVTTRIRDLPVPGSELPVDLFPEDTAARFLRDRVRDRNERAAEEDVAPVVERLGGLPLALEQASAWVARLPNRRFAQWVALFDDVERQPFPERNLPPEQATAETTWRVSIDAADADAPFAERLLAALAYFAPEKLPIPWLRVAAADLDGASSDDIEEAIEALHTYALITVNEDDTLDVHRVIRAASRRTAGPDALAFACHCVVVQDPGDNDPTASGAVTVALASHTMAVASAIDAIPPEGTRELGYLLNSLSQAHRYFGQVEAAEAAARKAVELAGIGPHHPDTLTSRNNLAYAYQDAGDLTRATPLYEQTLADRERILGPDHPDTLASRNNLAYAYQDAGDLTRATPLYEQSLAGCEQVLGPDHPTTGIVRENLESAQRDQAQREGGESA